MPTNADINAWLAANPNATDQQRRYAMNQFGVTPQQVAGATGMDPNQVQQRYYAAHYGADDINGWLQRNPGASDATMRQVMDQYGVSPYDVASATGTNLGQVTSRYEAAGPAGTTQAANMMPAGGFTGNTQAGTAGAQGYGAPATVNPLGGTTSPQGLGMQGIGQSGSPYGGNPRGTQGASAYGAPGQAAPNFWGKVPRNSLAMGMGQAAGAYGATPTNSLMGAMGGSKLTY